MSFANLIALITTLFIIGGLVFLWLVVFREEDKEDIVNINTAKVTIPATKELSYSTGNVFPLENFSKRKDMIKEDKNLLDESLTKIVYGE